MTPKPSFDLIAPFYQTLERLSVGPFLQRCRTAHLGRLGNCRRVLILGDGDGRFLAELLKAHPLVAVDSLDISPKMIALARRRVSTLPGASERVRFHIGDARCDPLPTGPFDLIVTNFFLDCFPADELGMLIPRIAAAASPEALWLDGDFRLPPNRWARLFARPLLALMYFFFAVTTRLPGRKLTDPAPAMEAEGFVLSDEVSWLGGFLTSRIWKSHS